jgi:hypothetical protein
MPVTTQDNTTALRHVKGSSIPESWRKQFGIKPNYVLTIIFKIEKKDEEKSKRNFFTLKEREAWENSLPTRPATLEEEKIIKRGRKEIDEGKCRIMTVKEFMKEVSF